VPSPFLARFWHVDWEHVDDSQFGFGKSGIRRRRFPSSERPLSRCLSPQASSISGKGYSRDFPKAAAQAANLGLLGWHKFWRKFSALLRAKEETIKVRPLMRHAEIHASMNFCPQPISEQKRHAQEAACDPLRRPPPVLFSSAPRKGGHHGRILQFHRSGSSARADGP
jgi:hypothetical protein